MNYLIFLLILIPSQNCTISIKAYLLQFVIKKSESQTLIFESMQETKN